MLGVPQSAGWHVPWIAAALGSLLLTPGAARAEPPTDAGLEPIFTGTDLTGWKVPPDGCWRVESGAIVGENGAARKGSMLYTERAYGDFVFETEVRFTGEIDSGVMLRRPELQVQIGVSRSLKRDMTCSFYTDGYPEAGRATRAGELLRAGDWNRIRIEARGDTFTVWLNGEPVSRYTDGRHADPGPIGLQIHAGVPMRVEFRAIRARTL